MTESIISISSFWQEAFNKGESVVSHPFNDEWILIITLLPLLIYIVILNLHKNPAIWLSKIVFSNRIASTSYRNRSYAGQLGHTLLFVISGMGIATFAYFFEVLTNTSFFQLDGFLLWLFNLGIISIGLALRYLTIILIGEFTGTRETFDEYGFNIAQFYKFIAIPLLFINFLIPFLEVLPDIVFIIIGVILFAILHVIRLIRLGSIFIRRSLSLLYLILYLCALEFTPVLVAIKYLNGIR